MEKPVGKGRANFPALIGKLKDYGFNGAYIIEREIHEGPEQYKDIMEAKAMLEGLLA